MYKDIFIEYVANSIIVANKDKGFSFWISIPQEIWAKRWYDFNMMLPEQFSESPKLKVIKDHDKYTDCLSSIGQIILYRSSSFINLKEYKNETQLCLGKHKNLFIISTYIPRFLFKLPQFGIKTLTEIKNRR